MTPLLSAFLRASLDCQWPEGITGPAGGRILSTLRESCSEKGAGRPSELPGGACQNPAVTGAATEASPTIRPMRAFRRVALSGLARVVEGRFGS